MRVNFFIVFLFLCFNSFGQYQTQSMLSDSAWIYVYGGASHDYARQIISTSDSGYIVVGSTSSFSSGNTDMYVIKTDRNCNRQWSHIYGTPAIEWGYTVRETFDHGFVFCGFTNQNTNTGYDVYLLKADSIGTVEWTKTIGDADWDFGYGIELSSNSGFIIIGKTYSPSNGGSDALIIKTDSLGNIVWKKNYGGALEESANAIYKTQQGDYLVLGETNSFGAGDKDFYLLKINENGDTLWTKTYGTAEFDEGNAIDTTSTGNYFLFGTTEGSPFRPGKEFYIIEINSDGDTLRTDYNGGTGDEVGRYILQLPNGNNIIGGTSNSGGLGGNSLCMFANLSAGSYAGAVWGGTQDEEGYSVALGNDGQIVFAGTTTSERFGNEDVYLVRIDTLLPSPQIYPLSMHYYNDSLVFVNEILDVNKNQLSVYPNPFHASTTFDIANSAKRSFNNCTIKITDITARVVKIIYPKHFPFVFENNDVLKEGSYIISYYVDDFIFSSHKLIIY